MSETRKVIGVFDSLVVKKDGIEFPRVRTWIRGVNDYETHGLEQLFPERGTIFLHVTACENKPPERNQVGLFNCIESPPGQSAKWQVDSTSRHLAKVIDCQNWDSKPDPLSFWDWLGGYKESIPCNILLSQGVFYVRRGKRGGIVGPFGISPDGKLIVRDHTYLFDGIDTFSVDISGRRHELIDTEFLKNGKPIVIDPREAIQRRLKLVNRSGGIEWLSRNKIQELSAALVNVNVADGSEWVTENLPRALELLTSFGNIDPKVAEGVLQIKGVSEALETSWKSKHADALKKAIEEIEALKKTSAGIKSTIEILNGELARQQANKRGLDASLLQLDKTIEEAKVKAKHVFDAELKRLAVSPESLALFAAWSNSGSNVASTISQPLIKIQRWDSERQKAPNLYDAFTNNLKITGLSPISANEVATVCGAALLAGQPVSFRSIFSELLVEALVSALGQPIAFWADLPAGLLDAVDWDSLLPADKKGYPLILQAVNRSDVSLVLGSKRMSVLRQALGYQKLDAFLFMTLDSGISTHVQSDFYIGPVIDDRMLRFNSNKANFKVQAFDEYAINLPEMSLISDESLNEIVGNDFAKLSLFATSANRMIYRRAISALKILKENDNEITRLFFKYWVLPRLKSDEITRVLEAYQEKWKSDSSITELAQFLISNE
jgi:hypothetical protein